MYGAADDFWGRDRSRAYFDVRVFCSFAQSHRNTSLSQCYQKNELEKKRCYEQRSREIEHGSFSPLVFSTSGGMARQTIQQNPPLDQMQTQLLPTTLSNQVPERSKIQHPPASQFSIIGKHGRGLPRSHVSEHSLRYYLCFYDAFVYDQIIILYKHH